MKQIKHNSGLSFQNIRMTAKLPRPAVQMAGQAVLILLGLIGAAFSFVSAFQLPCHEPTVLLAVCLFTAAFLFAFSHKIVKRVLLPVFAAGSVLLALYWRGRLVQGFILITNRMMETFTENSPWQFPVYLVTAAPDRREEYITCFFLFALFFLSWAVSWAVIRKCSFLLVFLLTSPFLFVPFFFTITPGLPYVLMVFTCWGGLFASKRIPLRSGTAKQRERTTARYPIQSQISFLLVPILLLSFGLSYLAAPLRDYERPEQAEALRQDFEDFASGFTKIIMGGGLAEGDLDVGDHISLTNRTMLRVKTDSPGPLYLKGYAGSYYTGRSWENFALNTPSFSEGSFYSPLSLIPDFISQNEIDAPPYSIEIQTVQADSSRLYLPYGVVLDEQLGALADSSSSEYFFRPYEPLESYQIRFYPWESVYQDAESLRLKPIFGEWGEISAREDAHRYGLESFYLYQPSSAIRSSELQNWELSYRSSMYHSSTDLPLGVQAEMQALIWQAGLSDFWRQEEPIEAAVQNVRAYLSQTASYTLTPGDTPAGKDFVSYFLKENKKGYCVHFASAGAVLLRAMGIPARYAEGYLATEEDLRAKGSDGFSAVREDHAHAWVEVYIPGYGWIPKEMTPGFSPAAAPEPPVLPELPESSEPETPPSRPTPPERVEPPASPASAPNPVLPTVLIILAAFLSAWLILVFLRRAALAKWKKALQQEDKNRAVLAAYSYLIRLAAFLEGPHTPATPEAGRALAAQGFLREDQLEELARIAQKAKFSPHPSTGEELEEMLAAAKNTADAIDSRITKPKRLLLRYFYHLK